MHRTGAPWTVALMVTALGLLIAGLDISEARSHTVQVDNRGGITVKARYITAGYLRATPRDPLSGKVDPGSTIVIAIALDTHSGDLGGVAERILRWTLPVE